MSLEKIFLTAEDQLQVNFQSRRVVFLGDFHLKDFDCAGLDPDVSPHKVERLPNIYSNKEYLVSVNDYLDGLLIRLIDKVGVELNSIHEIDYPPEFWRIPLSAWLLHYLHVLHDRYLRLKTAVELFGMENIVLLASKTNYTPLNNLSGAQFASDFSNESKYVSHLFADLAQKMGIPVEPTTSFESTAKAPDTLSAAKSTVMRLIQEGRVSTDSDMSAKKTSHLARILIKLRQLSYLIGGKSILVDPYKFIKSDKLKFMFLAGAKIRYDSPSLSSMGIDMLTAEIDAASRARLAGLDADDEFERIAVKLLPSYFPGHAMEHFHCFMKFAEKLTGYDAYFMAAKFYYVEPMHYAASIARHRDGATVILCQHGGGYGMYKRSALEFIERLCADKYISWGWTDATYGAKDNVTPLPQPSLSKLIEMRGKFQNNGTMLWVSKSVPKFLYRYYAHSLNINDYMKSKLNFIQALSSEVMKCMVYKPYPHDYGYLEHELKMLSGDTGVKVLLAANPFQALQSSKLVVVDHLGTTVLETFAAGIPTILFWDESMFDVRPEVSHIFDALRREGVLHHDPARAAAAANEAWKDVNGWWNRDSLVRVRREFVERFCLASPAWVKQWTDFFKESTRNKG